ncbi:MAG: hypothetical protein AB1634_00670 [Thermodesulfobacteriota bacterium]
MRVPFPSRRMPFGAGPGLAGFCLVLLAACALAGYGQVRPDTEITRQFRSQQVLADHQYYIFGPDAEPVAILAVDRRYQLAPSLWKPVQPTPAQLGAWVSRMDDRWQDLQADAYGALILDQAGNRIGVWYAVTDWTTVRLEADGQAVIFTPIRTRPHKRLY